MNDMTVNVKLTDEQARKLNTIAAVKDLPAEEAAALLLKQSLDATREQGPGLTRDRIRQILSASSLAAVIDPDQIWDDRTVYQDFLWLTDSNGQEMVPEFAVATKQAPNYANAAFSQDPRPPHQWRARLETNHEELGDLGDLPDDAFPHASLAEAAEWLHQIYRERTAQP